MNGFEKEFWTFFALEKIKWERRLEAKERDINTSMLLIALSVARGGMTEQFHRCLNAVTINVFELANCNSEIGLAQLLGSRTIVAAGQDDVLPNHD